MRTRHSLGIAAALAALTACGSGGAGGSGPMAGNPGAPQVPTGAVTSEADAILHMDQLRAAGFRGGGVRVGVISTGVVNLASYQSAGVLPADQFGPPAPAMLLPLRRRRTVATQPLSVQAPGPFAALAALKR